MKKTENNYAFIDSQNLYLGIKKLGWEIDFGKFRIFLKEKYSISKAYIFIGYLPSNKKLYFKLAKSGFICIFKPVLNKIGEKVKGNIDTELVLHTMVQFNNFDKAVIVSGDGDFYCLVEYLLRRSKLEAIIIPDEKRYSFLFKKFNSSNRNFIEFVNRKRGILEFKMKKLP